MKHKAVAAYLLLSSLTLLFAGGCGSGLHSQSATATVAAPTTPTTTPSTPTPAPSPTPTPATPSSPSTPTTPTTTPATPSGALPTPPANAVVFANIEQRTGWQSCDTAGCAGGSGAGASWLAQNQTSPSMNGNSMELYNSGVWANSLWWQKMGAENSATNMLWDFYAQVDESAASAAQALEFDQFQFVGGYNYMFGSQCDLGAGLWDVWDQANGRWVHTGIACKSFEAGVWHHIQWYVQRTGSGQNYKFVTLVVDGTAHPVNLTYAANYVGWGDDVGVQYQLDVNATGTGYHEWVDESKLTVW